MPSTLSSWLFSSDRTLRGKPASVSAQRATPHRHEGYTSHDTRALTRAPSHSRGAAVVEGVRSDQGYALVLEIELE